MLDAIRVRSVVYCRCDLGAPWGFRVSESPRAKFHLMLGGAATLTTEPDAEELALGPGDVVLLPHGTGHVMRDRSTSRARHLGRILDDHPLDGSGTLHYGGRGAKTLVMCGEFETIPAGGVLEWLPPVLVLGTATNGLGRWLDPMIDLVRSHDGNKPGDAAVVAKVADVFLTDVLCRYLTASRGPLPPFATNMDPAIAHALALMRARSTEQWTIAALAGHVGMSRSSFAARFRADTGASPIAYLTRLRLDRAAGDLAASTRSLAEIARAAGYDSESSFSKAFARQYREPPGQYRRTHQQGL